MSENATLDPRIAARGDRELIPRALIRASVGLVLITLTLTAFSVLSGREKSGVPAAGVIAAQTEVVIEAGKNGSAIVYDGTGIMLAEFGEGKAGFMGSVWRALEFERKRSNVALDAPALLIRYEDGRHILSDPQSGWRMHLRGFGPGNAEAFVETLMQAEAAKKAGA